MKKTKKLMSVIFALAIIVSVLSVCAVPANAQANGTGTYIITAQSVYVRSGAGTSYSAIGAIGNGEFYNVTAVDGIWGKISYNGKTGWISLNYGAKITEYGERGRTVIKSTPLRMGTGTSWSSHKTLSANIDVVQITGYPSYTSDGITWILVVDMTDDGDTFGFVDEQCLKPLTSATTYFPKYTGPSTTSIVDALAYLKVDYSYAYRAQIAAKNAITNYTGTPAQNTTMLNLLKNGTLKRP